MTELNIGANKLEGTISDTIGLTATRLKRLLLFDNDFTGTIPVLGYMPLEIFHAQNNRFSGILPFEYDYGGLWPDTLLEWWSFNNSLTGSIPVDIGRFVSGLEDLRLHQNEMTGSVPESLGELDRLVRLDLRSNNLTGILPESLGDLSSLRDMRVQFNSLEGAVPPSMCLLEAMHTLEADSVFHDLFVEKETETVLSVSLFSSSAVPAEKVDQNSNDENSRGLDEIIPSFPTLAEAIAAAREGTTDSSTSNTTTSNDTIDTNLQCYCCSKCCNSQLGKCQGFSSIDV